jgi:hypothetical protein
MQKIIFFKSLKHRVRFITVMQQIRKIYNGKLDQEYAAAVYILTADSATWNKASSYTSSRGIDIPTMLEEVDFSGGYSVLIHLAGNLFNGQVHVDPVEFYRLDERNFRIALSALILRRFSWPVSDFLVSNDQPGAEDSADY